MSLTRVDVVRELIRLRAGSAVFGDDPGWTVAIGEAARPDVGSLGRAAAALAPIYRATYGNGAPEAGPERAAMVLLDRAQRAADLGALPPGPALLETAAE